MQNACHFMEQTSKKDFCPYCEKVTEVSLVSKTETLPVLGEPVEYEAQVYKCNICNNEFAPSELEKRNFKVAYDIYRKRHKLLAPEEIRKIRKKYGLGQRHFSRFLGWGEITIHRYESGAIQDAAHNEVLSLLENPRNALQILELNRENLSIEWAEKLEKRIKELIEQEENGENRSRLRLIGLSDEEEQTPSINNGFKLFDLEKLENLILYILKKAKGIGKTRLNKLLWYCDFKYFKEYGVSLTGTQYIHLQYGPVPKQYDIILGRLQESNRVESEEFVYMHKSGEEFKALTPPNVSLFSEEEMETVDYVLKTLGSLNAEEISEKSHQEAGYKETSHRDVILYKYALRLSI